MHNFFFSEPDLLKEQIKEKSLPTDLHDPNSILETWNLTELPVQFFENTIRQHTSYHMYRGKQYSK